MAMNDVNPYEQDDEQEALVRAMQQRSTAAPPLPSQSPADMRVDGYVPTEENNPSRPELAGASAPSTSSPKRSYMDILNQYEYGPEGLLKAEKELADIGVQMQKDSSGRARGRLKLANGDIVDVVASGEGNDWWNNKTGTAWGNLNRGTAGLDAGGWSFGGGGGAPAPLSLTGAAGGPASTMIDGLTQQSTYEKMLAQLRGQLTNTADADALLALMGAR